jgi:hypothetical protein
VSDRSPQSRQGESELIETIRAIDVPAPERLHESIRAMTAQPRRRTSTLPRLRLGAAGAALAALVAAVAIVLTGGGGAGLSLHEASALTLDPATMSAPSENPHARSQLTADVEGISFPYWGERFGWRATGARVDRLHGRTITTVFYLDASGRRVGYAIVGGRPAPGVSTGAVRMRGGTAYRLSRVAGAEVVSWVRRGHLCVVSGRGVSGATLLNLASWREQGTAS